MPTLAPFLFVRILFMHVGLILSYHLEQINGYKCIYVSEIQET